KQEAHVFEQPPRWLLEGDPQLFAVVCTEPAPQHEALRSVHDRRRIHLDASEERGHSHRPVRTRTRKALPDDRQASSVDAGQAPRDRKSTRLNSSHVAISYAVFCLKKKKTPTLPY